jgi:hypothetical protein
MAINVNTVYQTVLLILNKEQRGYMTPLEFNKIGTQTQLEIFETYFESLNQQIRIPQTDTDYANRIASIDEKMNIFKEFETAVPVFVNGLATSVFNLPTQYSGAQPATEPNVTTTAVATYTLTSGPVVALSSQPCLTSVYQSSDAGVTWIQQSQSSFSRDGAVITFNSSTVAGLLQSVTLTPLQFHKLGGLFYTNGAIATQELERVDRTELYHLLSSNLTKPTQSYPIYVYEKNQVTVAPPTITSGIMTSYIRKPVNPLWNFTIGTGTAINSYVFNAKTSQSFELHASEQTELILKILLYAGVVVKDPQIIQVAAQQVAQENQNQQR